jgi:hypothetical protein
MSTCAATPRDGPGYMQDDSGRFEPLKIGKAVVLKVGGCTRSIRMTHSLQAPGFIQPSCV